MTTLSATPTLLGIPIEVRCRIYAHIFQDAEIEIGSHIENPFGVESFISNHFFPIQITATCRQLRAEAFPILLKHIKLSCNQRDFLQLNTHVKKSYTSKIETVLMHERLYGVYYPGKYEEVDAFPDLPALRVLEIQVDCSLRLLSLEDDTALSPEREKIIWNMWKSFLSKDPPTGSGSNQEVHC